MTPCLKRVLKSVVYLESGVCDEVIVSLVGAVKTQCLTGRDMTRVY